MAVYVPVQVKCDGCPKTINASCLVRPLGLGGVLFSVPEPLAGGDAIEGWLWPSYGTPTGLAVLCPTCRAARGL